MAYLNFIDRPAFFLDTLYSHGHLTIKFYKFFVRLHGEDNTSLVETVNYNGTNLVFTKLN